MQYRSLQVNLPTTIMVSKYQNYTIIGSHPVNIHFKSISLKQDNVISRLTLFFIKIKPKYASKSQLGFIFS